MVGEPNTQNQATLVCPIRGEFTPCDIGQLSSLIDFLKRDEPVSEPTAFRRGTMLPDGRLDLCKQSIGPGGIQAISEFVGAHSPTKHLLLGANGIGTVGADAVATVIRNSSSLETVYLGCNMITGDGTAALTEAIESGSSVKALWLKRNPIGTRGAAAVAELLRSGHDLKCLDLVHTEMPPVAFQEIVEALTIHNRTVTRLYLCGNQITADHCDWIQEMITRNQMLRHVYLGVNQIGDRGASLIAEGLRDNHTIQTLSLSSNRIGPFGAASLANAIKEHPSLEWLELGFDRSTRVLGEAGNHLGDDGAKSFADALRLNRQLVSLDISNNGITDTGYRFLLHALDENFTIRQLPIGGEIRRSLKLQLADALTRNATAAGNSVRPVDPCISAIQSVYRTNAKFDSQVS